jgi:hypothetical protein
VEVHWRCDHVEEVFAVSKAFDVTHSSPLHRADETRFQYFISHVNLLPDKAVIVAPFFVTSMR